MYCAAAGGFSLHANVTLRAGDQEGLRRLIRYGARQAFAEGRLCLTPDGQVSYRLTRPWGPKQRTTLTLPPVAFLHRLAALIPAPYLHLTRYSGIFAPNAHRRWEMTKAGIRARKRHHCGGPSTTDPISVLEMPPSVPRSIPWADLLARTFKIDVLKCPRCEGRLSIIAFVTNLLLVRKILTHLGLAATASSPEPSVRHDHLDLDFDIDTADDPAGRTTGPAAHRCRGPPPLLH
jgi:hypothetical protein